MKFPTFKEFYEAFSTDLTANVPGTNPFIRNKWARGFAKGAAGSQSLIVASMKDLISQLTPLTATGVWLDMWGRVNDLYKLKESPAIGRIQYYAATSETIVVGDTFVSDDNGKTYVASIPTSVIVRSFDENPTSLYRITSTGDEIARAYVSHPHGLSVGDSIFISGSSVTEFNGSYTIVSVPDSMSFTYSIGASISLNSFSPYMNVKRNVSIVSMTQTTPTDPIIVELNDTSLLVDGQYIKFSGTTSIDNNPVYSITIVDSTHFSVEGTLLSSFTEGVIFSYHANVIVTCISTGADTDIEAGGTFTADQGAPVALVTQNGLQGGGDAEDQESFRSRILLKRAKQEGVFTNTDITLAAKSINGNDSVIIQNPTSLDDTTNTVRPGFVDVYILRTNSAFSVIPIGTILERTKQAIIQQGPLPANTPEYALRVLAPTLRPIDIVISNITPDTSTMRQAVKNQYVAYFKDYAKMGSVIDGDVLRAQLLQVVDLSASVEDEAYIDTFDWSLPSSNIALDPTEVPSLGTVTINGTEV